MSWITRKLGIDRLIYEQKNTNVWLKRIAEQSKRQADLQQKYNDAYHVK